MTPEMSGPTGPRTDEGKARSSQNAITLGLFTMRDYVRPEEQDEYAALCETLQSDLSPEGALEQSFAAAIIGANWRLRRRCSLIEADLSDQYLLDPMLGDDERAGRVQTSVDRARAHAHNILRRSIAELRRLQTERTFRDELSVTHPALCKTGLTDYHQVLKAMLADERGTLAAQEVEKGKIEAALASVPGEFVL